ncbi:MAG: (2Fe-2S) ferredoxin domain-containing protein [Eubacteriales bacterium]
MYPKNNYKGSCYMKINVCIGSSCHLKGSRKVVERLQFLISDNNIKDKVQLRGVFCMNNCQKGVCVSVDDQIFSVTPETTDTFFYRELMKKVYLS